MSLGQSDICWWWLWLIAAGDLLTDPLRPVHCTHNACDLVSDLPPEVAVV